MFTLVKNYLKISTGANYPTLFSGRKTKKCKNLCKTGLNPLKQCFICKSSPLFYSDGRICSALCPANAGQIFPLFRLEPAANEVLQFLEMGAFREGVGSAFYDPKFARSGEPREKKFELAHRLRSIHFTGN